MLTDLTAKRKARQTHNWVPGKDSTLLVCSACDCVQQVKTSRYKARGARQFGTTCPPCPGA